MTPSEMTNEQLADALMKSEIAVFGACASMLLAEATSRLRTSIPRPVVEVVWVDSGDTDTYEVRLNGHKWETFVGQTDYEAQSYALALRTALGLHGEEGV